MKPWMPAAGAVLAAVLLATGAGVVLGGLTPSPGSTAPIVLRTVTQGALESSGIRLTQPPLPIECTPAGWVHLTLTGRCPVSQSAAEAAARSALPVFKVMPMPVGVAIAQAAVVGGSAPVVSNGSPQIKEAVLAWADVPGRSSPNGQALHAMVWAVAIDSPALGLRMCPPPVVRAANGSVAPMAPFCIGGARYLVFIDAMSGKLRFLIARP
jgi:hypothetical protein